MAAATETVKAKKKCCKRRPVVLKRLAGEGLAERVDGRRYELSADLRKKQVKAARKR